MNYNSIDKFERMDALFLMTSESVLNMIRAVNYGVDIVNFTNIVDSYLGLIEEEKKILKGTSDYSIWERRDIKDVVLFISKLPLTSVVDNDPKKYADVVRAIQIAENPSEKFLN